MHNLGREKGKDQIEFTMVRSGDCKDRKEPKIETWVIKIEPKKEKSKKS